MRGCVDVLADEVSYDDDLAGPEREGGGRDIDAVVGYQGLADVPRIVKMEERVGKWSGMSRLKKGCRW